MGVKSAVTQFNNGDLQYPMYLLIFVWKVCGLWVAQTFREDRAEECLYTKKCIFRKGQGVKSHYVIRTIVKKR